MHIRISKGKIEFSFVENVDSFTLAETRKLRGFIGRKAEDYMKHFLEKKLFMKVIMFNVMDPENEDNLFFVGPNMLQGLFQGEAYAKQVLQAGGKMLSIVAKDPKGKKYVFQDVRLANEKLKKVELEIKGGAGLEKLNAEFNLARNMKYMTTVLDKGKVVQKELKSSHEGVALDKDGSLKFSKAKKRK
jgi:hypothetical protein